MFVTSIWSPTAGSGGTARTEILMKQDDFGVFNVY
jgi:hypothetical protein